jgi:hypothetical protein
MWQPLQLVALFESFFPSAAVLDVPVSCLSLFLIVVVVFSSSRVVLGVAVGTFLVEFFNLFPLF